MLLQFNFSNFKSFKDDNTLDLTATKITEYSNKVRTIGNEKILPLSAIFGANAHGKSNVIEAFRYMTDYVINSLNYGGETDKKDDKSNFYKPTPFLFDNESKEKVSTFEVYFMESNDNNSKQYNYGFTVNSAGVEEEWLNYRTKSYKKDEYKNIFYRNTLDNTLDLSGLPKNCVKNIEIALEKETLIVSLGSKLKIDKLKLIRNWFYKNEFANFSEPMEDLFISRLVPNDFATSKKVQDDVVRYLNSFDTSIVGFEVEKIDNNTLSINSMHKVANSNTLVGIPLEEESSGTLKMFTLYRLLQNVLERGGVLFIDELNARLHPLLVRNFLITFTDTEINTNNAQLIFTTHDAWQLKSDTLRRDEIWFTEKDSSGVSTLYSLHDFKDDDSKIRKDEDYEKNYLLGKYGAIPNLTYLDILGV